jgi:hypothetical protein
VSKEGTDSTHYLIQHFKPEEREIEGEREGEREKVGERQHDN